MTRIKLKADDIEISKNDEYYFRDDGTHLILDCNGQDAKQLKKQILEEHEDYPKLVEELVQLEAQVKELKEEIGRLTNAI